MVNFAQEAVLSGRMKPAAKFSKSSWSVQEALASTLIGPVGNWPLEVGATGICFGVVVALSGESTAGDREEENGEDGEVAHAGAAVQPTCRFRSVPVG